MPRFAQEKSSTFAGLVPFLSFLPGFLWSLSFICSIFAPPRQRKMQTPGLALETGMQILDNVEMLWSRAQAGIPGTPTLRALLGGSHRERMFSIT